MIYIEIDLNNNITYQHHKPFDKKLGLNKTKEQLLVTGKLVSVIEIPSMDLLENKYVNYKYNALENIVYYEILDRELTKDEKQQQDILMLKKQNANLLLEIAKMKMMVLNRAQTLI